MTLNIAKYVTVIICNKKTKYAKKGNLTIEIDKKKNPTKSADNKN